MTEWKLVPVKPTPEMIRAAEKQWMVGSNVDMAEREWNAMLAAAPKPPERKPLTDEQIRDLLESEFLGGPGNRDLQDDLRIARAIEAAHGIKQA